MVGKQMNDPDRFLRHRIARKILDLQQHLRHAFGAALEGLNASSKDESDESDVRRVDLNPVVLPDTSKEDDCCH